MKVRTPPKRCGECRACCIHLKIDTPEYKKAAGVLCPHHTGAGCGIYETRYPVCKGFLCGFLMFDELGPDWRPDRCGMMILQVPQASVPPKYRPAGHGVQFVVLEGEKAVTRPAFARYVAELVARGVAVYLTARKPHTLVNEYLEATVRAGDTAGVQRALLHLYGLMVAADRQKGVLGFFRALPYFYRLQVEHQRAVFENRKTGPRAGRAGAGRSKSPY